MAKRQFRYVQVTGSGADDYWGVTDKPTPNGFPMCIVFDQDLSTEEALEFLATVTRVLEEEGLGVMRRRVQKTAQQDVCPF